MFSQCFHSGVKGGARSPFPLVLDGFVTDVTDVFTVLSQRDTHTRMHTPARSASAHTYWPPQGGLALGSAFGHFALPAFSRWANRKAEAVAAELELCVRCAHGGGLGKPSLSGFEPEAFCFLTGG